MRVKGLNKRRFISFYNQYVRKDCRYGVLNPMTDEAWGMYQGEFLQNGSIEIPSVVTESRKPVIYW
jgi:hypothetical protein